MRTARCDPMTSNLTPSHHDPVQAHATHRLCALLTCFNRREKTLECLQALEASTGLQGVELRAVLVDDGSSDGTARAVAERFAWVTVIRPDHSEGALFWCRGMHRAFEAALRIGFDDYLWLNDDTMLSPDALARLLASRDRLRADAAAPVLLVGSTVDAVTGQVTYGGELRPSAWRPMLVVRILPGQAPQPCDSMTGNIVLISAEAAQRVGNVDPLFEHSMGDTDYALRARALGVHVWVDAGVHGTCSDNPPRGTWVDPTQPLGRRWRDIHTRKGLPWRSWLALTRRHAGVLWPIHFALPYAKVLVQGLLWQPLHARMRGRP